MCHFHFFQASDWPKYFMFRRYITTSRFDVCLIAPDNEILLVCMGIFKTFFLYASRCWAHVQSVCMLKASKIQQNVF